MHIGIIQWSGFSQVKIDDQPDTSYYRYVVKTISPHALTEKETVSMKAQPIPANLADTLKKYDWFDMGGFNYIEGKFKSNHAAFRNLNGADPVQLDFIRYCNDGIVGQFYLQKTPANAKTVFTNTFDRGTASSFLGIKTVKNLTYLIMEDFGEKTYIRVISYKNRTLVVDLTQYGKIGEKPVKFRIVYFGIEQKFDWKVK